LCQSIGPVAGEYILRRCWQDRFHARYFRLLALFGIISALSSGEATFIPTHAIRELRRFEAASGPYDETEEKSGMIIYATLALCSRGMPTLDDDGTYPCFTHRLFLMRLDLDWLMGRLYAHRYTVRDGVYLGCSCQCKIIPLLEHFWRTTRRKMDYIQILSEYVWIWELSPMYGLFKYHPELFDRSIKCLLS
jgi:hypothetical protein